MDFSLQIFKPNLVIYVWASTPVLYFAIDKVFTLHFLFFANVDIMELMLKLMLFNLKT